MGPGESSTRGKRPAVVEDDAPALRVESPTQAYRRGVVEGLGKLVAGGGGRRVGTILAGLAVLTGGAGAGVAYQRSQAETAQLKCSSSTVQLVLHLDATGRSLADHHDAAGDSDTAALVRAMTDVRSMPEDIQLCVLLSKQRPEVEP